jgi:hypothetical protein
MDIQTLYKGREFNKDLAAWISARNENNCHGVIYGRKKRGKLRLFEIDYD